MKATVRNGGITIEVGASINANLVITVIAETLLGQCPVVSNVLKVIISSRTLASLTNLVPGVDFVVGNKEVFLTAGGVKTTTVRNGGITSKVGTSINANLVIAVIAETLLGQRPIVSNVLKVVISSRTLTSLTDLVPSVDIAVGNKEVFLTAGGVKTTTLNRRIASKVGTSVNADLVVTFIAETLLSQRPVISKVLKVVIGSRTFTGLADSIPGVDFIVGNKEVPLTTRGVETSEGGVRCCGCARIDGEESDKGGSRKLHGVICLCVRLF